MMELTIDCPRPLIDITFMHKKWMVLSESRKASFKKYHGKFLASEATSCQLHSNVNDNFTSVACIPLSISVQTQIMDLRATA